MYRNNNVNTELLAKYKNIPNQYHSKIVQY